jgi:hypothetical protein
MPEYCTELLWRGRQIDQSFDLAELLFYRVKGFDPQGLVNVDDILFPNTSVNRGKFSRPEHALCLRYPAFADWKVAQFKVSEIPGDIIEPVNDTVFTFRIFHDPTLKTEKEDENYAHSEVRVFVGEVRKKNVASSHVQKTYRMELRRVMQSSPLPQVAQ